MISRGAFRVGMVTPSLLIAQSAMAQTAYFSRGWTTTMYSSTLSGSTWSSPASYVTLPNEAKWVQAAVCPTRDEVAVATSDYDSRICVTFRVSGTWGSSQTMVSSSGLTTMRKFSVAYEQLSGDCLVVYAQGTSFRCDSRTGANGTLGTPTIAQNITSYATSVRLYSRPASNEVLLLTCDMNRNLRASFWSGSAWAPASVISTSLPTNVTQCFDGMYQSSSGVPMVVYSEASIGAPKYRTYSPTGWSSPTNMGSIPSAARWIMLAPHPTNNTAVCVMIDAGKRVHAFTWNGSTWTGPTTLTTDCGYADRRPAAAAWEPDGSHALVAYSDNTNTPRYVRWDGTSWSSSASLANMGAKAQFIQVVPLGSGSELAVLASDLSSNLHGWKWDGTSMSAMATVENLLGGENDSEQFHQPAGGTPSVPSVTLTSWKEVTGEE